MVDTNDTVTDKLADVFQALGNPIRLGIVEHLSGGEKGVSDIIRAVDAEQSNVSRHLSRLKNAGVIIGRKDGLNVFYRLSSWEFTRAVNCMRKCAMDLQHASSIQRA